MQCTDKMYDNSKTRLDELMYIATDCGTPYVSQRPEGEITLHYKYKRGSAPTLATNCVEQAVYYEMFATQPHPDTPQKEAPEGDMEQINHSVSAPIEDDDPELKPGPPQDAPPAPDTYQYPDDHEPPQFALQMSTQTEQTLILGQMTAPTDKDSTTFTDNLTA